MFRVSSNLVFRRPWPFLLFFALGLSCLVPRQRTGVSPVERQAITARFDHARHRTSLLETGVTCLQCHPMVRPEDVSGDQTEDRVPAGVCHACHQDRGSAGAPQRCTTCHQELEPLLPEWHRGRFEHRHGRMARLDGERCRACHQPDACYRCHHERGTAEQRAHDRNFRQLHSIEARIAPSRCDRCHQRTFCIDCHREEPRWR